jgi:5'-methylthioadenosine phosphorylase
MSAAPPPAGGGAPRRSRQAAARARAAEIRARLRLPTSAEADIAVIGGSGLYELDGLEDAIEVRPPTPFGPPSDALVVGSIGPTRVAFLARHGRGHVLLPSEVPYQANLWAIRLLGAGRVIAVSACGSLQEAVAPRDVVVPDQLVDRTHGRPATFFGAGIVAHVAFADPFCPELHARLATVAEAVIEREPGGRRDAASPPTDRSGTGPRAVHRAGTYLAMEGPAFSTRAEAALHRSWGMAVVGMTGAPEAKLAREAELCYAMLAFATDDDCWRDPAEAEAVTVGTVLANLAASAATARAVVRDLAAEPLPSARGACACARALEGAVATDPRRIHPARAAELSLLLGDSPGGAS